jgi:hypothetical protein
MEYRLNSQHGSDRLLRSAPRGGVRGPCATAFDTSGAHEKDVQPHEGRRQPGSLVLFKDDQLNKIVVLFSE